MKIHISEKAINLIKSFEFLKTSSYICPAGYKTIGYGHVIMPYEKFTEITSTCAEELLVKDIAIAERAVLNHIKCYLSLCQFEALVSFTFNVGAGALQRSTLRMKINQGYHEEVPKELAKWVWASGRKLPGLVKRRKIEADYYNNKIG